MLCRTAPAVQRGVMLLSQHRFGILHHRRWTSSSASHRCGGVLCGDAAGPLSSARRWCTTSEDGHVTLETTSSSRRPSSTVECEDDEVRSRRAYYNSCKELRLAVDAELRAEVARDMVDGESAIPPLAPGGWRVQHDGGTAFFTMHRRWEGSRMRNSPEEARFRSVNDEQHGVKTEREPPTASTVLRRGRDGKYVRGSSQPDGAKLTTAEVVRSSMDVTIMAHFRTQDLSLRDPTVDICEWSLFDVVVAKEDPRRAAASRTISEPPRRQLVGQQKVWDQHECIWIRLANVNSELRIRSLQVLSRAEARTLSEFAAMGKPEAGMMEVMQQLRQMEERRLMHRRRTSSSSRSRHNDHRQVHLSPSAVPTNTSFTPSEDGSAAHVLHGDTTSAAERLLCTDSGTSGDYARALCYGGPYISELSKELQECLMSYVVNEVGITPEVAEYICQMKYFMEQSEYVGWLATLRQLASVGL